MSIKYEYTIHKRPYLIPLKILYAKNIQLCSELIRYFVFLLQKLAMPFFMDHLLGKHTHPLYFRILYLNNFQCSA